MSEPSSRYLPISVSVLPYMPQAAPEMDITPVPGPGKRSGVVPPYILSQPTNLLMTAEYLIQTTLLEENVHRVVFSWWIKCMVSLFLVFGPHSCAIYWRNTRTLF